jgi:hypothetical protein
VHETAGAYPAPLAVADQIEAVARRLRPLVGADDDPATILHQVAVGALAISAQPLTATPGRYRDVASTVLAL